jgi:hypothetical protein
VAPYTQDVWGPYRWTEFWVEGSTGDDDKEPEKNVKVQLFKNGRLLAWGESGNVRFYEGLPWSIPLGRDLVPDILGRDVSGCQVIFTMFGDDDDWKMNFRLWGRLENRQAFKLCDPGRTYEVNDRNGISEYVGAPF